MTIQSADAVRGAERFLRIRHGQLSGIVARVVGAGAGLMMLPLLLGYLGKPAYGLWMVIASIVAWMQLAEIGLASGTGNALAEANGRSDPRAASAYASTALVLLGTVGLVGLTLALLVARVIPWRLVLGDADPGLLAEAPACFAAAAGLLFLSLPLSLSYTIAFAHQRAYVSNWLQACAALLSLGAVWCAIRAGLPLAALVIAAGAGPLVVQLALWARIGSVVPGLRVDIDKVTRVALARVARSSLPLFLFQIGALAANELASVVLAQISTLSAVADYNVLLRLYISVFAVGTALSFPYYAAIREAFERRELAWVRGAIWRALATRVGVVAALGLPLVWLGDWLVSGWLGLSLERPLAFGGWSAFLACLILASASSLLSEILSSLDDIWFQVALVATTALVVVAGMLILVPALGVAGVFAAMALATLLPLLICGLRLSAAVRLG